MSAFGIDPFGTSPLGGPGNLGVLGVLPAGNSQFIIVFDRVPKTKPATRPGSALNLTNYSLAPIDPSILTGNGELWIPRGETVPTRSPIIAEIVQDEDDDKQFVATTDVLLEPNVRYQLDISAAICGVGEEDFFGDTVFLFRAPGLPRIARTPGERSEDRYRDFDYGIVDDDGNSAYRQDSNGDIAIQNSSLSLKKRIQRRLLTPPGGFAWTAAYGTFPGLKTLVKPGQLQALANRIAEQVRQEPDVADASAQTVLSRNAQGSFVDVTIFVRTRAGSSEQVSFSQVIL